MKKGMACLLALVMALALTACTRTAQPQTGGDTASTDPAVPAEPDAGYNTGAGEVVQIMGFRSINIEGVSGAVNVELYDGEGIQLSETMLDGGAVAPRRVKRMGGRLGFIGRFFIRNNHICAGARQRQRDSAPQSTAGAGNQRLLTC